MTSFEELGRRYYRLGLGAAQRRDVSAALRYAEFARILDPGHGDAAHLAEICRHELGETDGEAEIGRLAALAAQKKWKAAAGAAGSVRHQSVRLLNIQGCLWTLAGNYTRAADCFAGALAKDRGNVFAADALAGLGRRRNRFWRWFFCSFLILMK
jgi:tetratricopeptide (TPR) repeat protein